MILSVDMFLFMFFHRYYDVIITFQEAVNPGFSDPIIFHLLAAAIIRFEISFSELVHNDPKNRWSDTNLHPFLAKLQEAYNLAGVSADERSAWQKEVTKGFESSNFTGLPINQMRYNNELVYVDSRCILDVTHQTAVRVEKNTSAVEDMKDVVVAAINGFSHRIESLTQELASQRLEIASLKSQIVSLNTQNQETNANSSANNDSQPMVAEHIQDAAPNLLPYNNDVTVESWYSLERKLKASKDPVAVFLTWTLGRANQSYMTIGE